jgi:hypothetical protein
LNCGMRPEPRRVQGRRGETDKGILECGMRNVECGMEKANLEIRRGGTETRGHGDVTPLFPP